MLSSKRKAVILLSGGLDSATVLAIAKEQHFEAYALSFSYGQRQTIELNAAKRVAQAFHCVEHKIAHIDLTLFGGSALTDTHLDVPKHTLDTQTVVRDHIPITYVPARNTIFLSFALAWAEVLGAFDIFVGVNAVDYSGYPDCRPEFIHAFQHLANVATGAGVSNKGMFQIHAPLIALSKADIIREGTRLNVPYALTHSCYDPIHEAACGLCDACILRKEGFRVAGVADPTLYV